MYKALAVGRFIDGDRQTDRQPETKSLFIPQCYDNFKAFGREKTSYCTERFSKLCQFVWPCSFVKVVFRDSRRLGVHVSDVVLCEFVSALITEIVNRSAVVLP